MAVSVAFWMNFLYISYPSYPNSRKPRMSVWERKSDKQTLCEHRLWTRLTGKNFPRGLRANREETDNYHNFGLLWEVIMKKVTLWRKRKYVKGVEYGRGADFDVWEGFSEGTGGLKGGPPTPKEGLGLECSKVPRQERGSLEKQQRQ